MLLNMPAATSQIAPGTRLRIRDEDWLVRRVDRASSGQRQSAVVGLSPLVRNRETLFLEKSEKEIEIVDPAKTRPVQDISARYRNTRLHLEFLLHQATPSDHRIHLDDRPAMDVVPYQLDPATLPTGPFTRTIIWNAPFSRWEREQNYQTVLPRLEFRLT